GSCIIRLWYFVVCVNDIHLLFFLTRLPRISTLFPYTTLFRSFYLELSTRDDTGEKKDKFIGTDEQWAVATKVLEDACVESGLERSEEHTSELQSRENLVCRLLLEKKKTSVIIENIVCIRKCSN